MSEAPSDHYRNHEMLELLRSIAAGIYARHGVDFATANRAGGWSNITWLAGGLALRLSTRQGNDRILREAKLASILPPEVGYPPILETGVTGGYEWSLSKEIPGKNLGHVWPNLDWDERTTALCQLWDKVQAVHTTDIAAAADLARKKSWFYASDAGEVAACFQRLVQQRVLSSYQVEILGKALECFWKVLPEAVCVLNHGDLTVENALWNEGQVVALLDFEFAVIAPAELDLNELLKFVFAPADMNDPFQESRNAGFQQARQAVTELALPVLNHPGGKDLLMGYAILLELWLLEEWLSHPEGEGPLKQWQPYRCLVSLADGRGGYLAPILAS
jgi:aminoglycoside phosphotransferase (APT) family kinase protein